MMRPGVPAPNLAPLMGAEVLRERGGVRYHELKARSLLNRCDSPRMPFRWTVNPYRGCAMGCRYCYAAYTHGFMGIDAPEDFHSVVYLKTGAEAETARRLLPIARKGDLVALGTATDPYQPAEAEARITRRFLESVAGLRRVRLGITTKGALILRDLDLLRRIHERSRLSVHVSLISLDAGLLRRAEPWAPSPEARLEVMRRLAEAGIRVALSVAPVLPLVTDGEAGLDALFAAAAARGVRSASCSILFLRSPTREKYLRWLAREFPRHLAAYEEAYAGRVYLGGRYRERLLALVARLREKHGLADAFARERAGRPPEEPAQLRLWS
ncbi:MAG TPA: radical SAM protein [Vicinamibacteria bacterium]|nr:radical SAM protein [Vicinamibacteria bacterium]